MVSSSMIGPIATHCPPPDGMNMLTNPAMITPITGHVVGVANAPTNLTMSVASPGVGQGYRLLLLLEGAPAGPRLTGHRYGRWQ